MERLAVAFATHDLGRRATVIERMRELADWITHDPAVFLALQEKLGSDGVRRLDQLLSESGGLTPSEAREWFDCDSTRWASVQSSISCAIVIATMFKKIVPKHLIAWVFQQGDWNLIRATYPQYTIE